MFGQCVQVLAPNLFERIGDEWLMIHHQGWRSWGESKLIVHNKGDLPMKGLLVALVVGLGCTACASTGPVSMGKDTYMLAKPGGFLTVAGGGGKG